MALRDQRKQGRALCLLLIELHATRGAHGIIMPRGTTALFNGGASSFDAFAHTLGSFGDAVTYATLPCYTLRGEDPASINITQQAAFCEPFYAKVKALPHNVYAQPSIAMGGNYAYAGWKYAESFAKVFVAEALRCGWDGYWIDMEISAHTKPAQIAQGIAFLQTVGAAFHANGIRLSIEEKSTFLNDAPPRALINNGTGTPSVTVVVLRFVVLQRIAVELFGFTATQCDGSSIK